MKFKALKLVASVFVAAVGVVSIAGLAAVSYVYGYTHGMLNAQQAFESKVSSIEQDPVLVPTPTPQTIVKVLSPQESKTPQPQVVPANWGGPDLWQAVNKRRQEFGVSELAQKDELCTIASIRLNELLELGKLDGHEGFSNLPERRPDLKWIFEQYSISEFLVYGAQSAQEAVSLWENTLGHKKLLTGGEYVWGCIYAQNTFGVAITAY